MSDIEIPECKATVIQKVDPKLGIIYAVVRCRGCKREPGRIITGSTLVGSAPQHATLKIGETIHAACRRTAVRQQLREQGR